ncbi:hypothetical protein B0H14DRAFT_513104 [Mycena olivaceomarginata]|nr:hypothetical protein B0H14DRAFT_513104 [Mycena olivaceomarginata]
MEWTGQYLNLGERNIHVWATQYGPHGKRCLVGGCWNDGGITIQTFHEWVEEIISDDLNWALVFAGPNTQHMLPPAFDAHAMPLGDYFMYRVASNGLRPFRPKFRKLYINSRTVTRGGTGTNTPLNSRRHITRQTVRLRDLACRVTGIGVMQRLRGINFKGMQVAHIFPLGYMSKASKVLTDATVAALGTGDIPENAMLMRSDVHDQFDDYQFGFWQTGTHGPFVFYRFERSGAPSVAHGSATQMFPQLGVAPPSPTAELLENHFITGLLWHVRGFGRDMGQ